MVMVVEIIRFLELAKTSHVLVLNPDTILSKNCIKELIHQANLIKNKFAILAPCEKNIIKKEITGSGSC